MTEFKIGDKVETVAEPKNGPVGIITNINKKDITVKFDDRSLTVNACQIKKVGELRPNLPNRDEYINWLYGNGERPQPNVCNILNEDEILKLQVAVDKKFQIGAYKNDICEIITKVINYAKNSIPQSNPDKIFEMLGVKPNEEFEVFDYINTPLIFKRKIDTDLIVYFYNDCWVEDEFHTLNYLLNGNWKIVKKPLLTDEEKKFISNFEFNKLMIKGHSLNFFNDQYCSPSEHHIYLKSCKLKFNNLERGKDYTKQELGLEFN